MKCSINGNRQQLLLYFEDSEPAYLALCLGLGVTKVQLLGEKYVRHRKLEF